MTTEDEDDSTLVVVIHEEHAGEANEDNIKLLNERWENKTPTRTMVWEASRPDVTAERLTERQVLLRVESPFVSHGLVKDIVDELKPFISGQWSWAVTTESKAREILTEDEE